MWSAIGWPEEVRKASNAAIHEGIKQLVASTRRRYAAALVRVDAIKAARFRRELELIASELRASE
jgi:hypothetical protein